jgi:hypothetical protein
MWRAAAAEAADIDTPAQNAVATRAEAMVTDVFVAWLAIIHGMNKYNHM